jgi:4'-phosphopantetheinyl transferase
MTPSAGLGGSTILKMSTIEVLRGEVQLWHASLAVSDSDIDRLSGMLSAEELQRARRFRVEKAKKRFIAARSALRIVLGRASGTDPREVVFAFGANGKPRLAEGGPCFNASDSGDVVAIGLAREELGVDIEVKRPMARRIRLARRICTARELEQFESLPAAERGIEILRLWTCKEAALKAVGTGLRGGLRNVEFELPAHDQPEVRKLLDETDGWTLLPGDLGPDIICSVIVRGTGWRVVNRNLEIHST